MAQTTNRTGSSTGKPRASVFSAIVATAAVSFASLVPVDQANAQMPGAQVLSYAPEPQSAFPSADTAAAPNFTAQEDVRAMPERLRRTTVALATKEAPGTIIIDTGNTVLYYVVAPGRAVRYGVGVGREGFTWSGVQTITNKAEWPDWHPPAQMIARQPYLPRFMAGGPGNPLGARAMYLGSTEYRIHGTNDPTTIGKFVSSGCVRLTNEDVTDLFNRVSIGTKVVVMPKNAVHLAARPIGGSEIASAALRPRAQVSAQVSMLPSGRQALNLSTSALY
jgi:lipoprotein-anchoring transpeptidase ErfK/SrfK